jgi:hypothetical protein
VAIDTLMSFVGTYYSVEDAEADYQLVKTLHTEAGDRPGRGAVPFAAVGAGWSPAPRPAARS